MISFIRLGLKEWKEKRMKNEKNKVRKNELSRR